jgi:hypothetical protein
METKHTQGEWAIDDNEIYSENTDHGAAICTMNTTSAHFTEEEAEANARLIAAAPELLEAMYLVVMDFENEGGFINPDTIEATRNAIQKATQP